MLSYYKELFFYLLKITRDKEYAKEILQETYSRVIQVKGKKEIKHERAFLYKVAKNLLVDEERKKSKLSFIEFEEEKHNVVDDDPEDIILDENSKKRVLTLMEQLPKKRRQALVLYLFEDLSRKEISIKMKISPNAVEKHITRAIMQIKNNFDKR